MTSKARVKCLSLFELADTKELWKINRAKVKCECEIGEKFLCECDFFLRFRLISGSVLYLNSFHTRVSITQP
jgi:hypothetical protein